MDTAIETIEMSDNRTLKIYQDDNPESPREWDNLGIMACFHRRYDLGDKHEFCNELYYVGNGEWDNYEDSPDGLMQFLNRDDVISMPLYLYDHSGISISTNSFIGRAQHAEWDSGMVGYIYITKEKIRKEYGWKLITASRVKKIKEYLANEVKTYDDYLTGNVYGFKLICNICEEELDSCWGYYESSDAIEEIKEHVQNCKCEDCHAIVERLNQQLIFEFV